MQTNLILSDIMNTGFPQDVQDFLSYNTLKEQKFEIVNEYYELHQYKDMSFDRKIAMIDYRQENKSICQNEEFQKEFARRLDKLKDLGFSFVACSPYENSLAKKPSYGYGGFYPDLADVECKHWWSEDTFWWFYMHRKYSGKQFVFDHSEKKFDFLYLNKMKRQYRIKLWNELNDGELLDNSIKTFHSIRPDLQMPDGYELPYVQNNYPIVSNYDQDIFEKPYNHSAISVVSEGDIDDVLLTEKIFKPIIASQPFVVHGYKGILATLRGLGFKTFDPYIDESYDDAENDDDRRGLIRQSLEKIKKQDYKKLYADTQSIREHNSKHFWDKKSVSKQVNKTIQSWLD